MVELVTYAVIRQHSSGNLERKHLIWGSQLSRLECMTIMAESWAVGGQAWCRSICWELTASPVNGKHGANRMVWYWKPQSLLSVTHFLPRATPSNSFPKGPPTGD